MHPNAPNGVGLFDQSFGEVGYFVFHDFFPFFFGFSFAAGEASHEVVIFNAVFGKRENECICLNT